MSGEGRLRRLEDGRLYFDCPGCGHAHAVAVGDGPGPRWEWNGRMDAPTFSPSIKAEWTWGPERERRVCHFYVNEGRIQYLGDCTHRLAGTTVDMPAEDAP